jgi:hypothetical protein
MSLSFDRQNSYGRIAALIRGFDRKTHYSIFCVTIQIGSRIVL